MHSRWLSYPCCHAGALEDLKREQAEHDSALKGLRKDKDKATKVRYYGGPYQTIVVMAHDIHYL